LLITVHGTRQDFLPVKSSIDRTDLHLRAAHPIVDYAPAGHFVSAGWGIPARCDIASMFFSFCTARSSVSFHAPNAEPITSRKIQRFHG